jgi:multidrug efflux pump subunit AcrA (membrane-fusion protein)
LKGVLHVNRTALREEGGKTFVFTAVNGSAVKKEITLGRDTGFDVEILSGLAEDDQLITDGQNMVSDGSKIKVISE